MKQYKKITDDLYWIGGNDRRLTLFENVYPIAHGASFNSYLIKDEKNIVFDTVDKSISQVFLNNIEELLGEETLDYIVVNHMEPDHAATLGLLAEKYPNAQVVCNEKTKNMIHQFFEFDIDSRAVLVKEGDTISSGRHTYQFVMAPMVHWPEVMVTYDVTDHTLFSADAFGTFGALEGNLFADEVNFETEWLDDARRYYTNIVGKYGMAVQTLLKKASGLTIDRICPLHGPVWRENIGWYLDKYIKWSNYEPEDQEVMIVYGSVYGNTEATAELLAMELADQGIKHIKMYDVSRTDVSVLVSEAFRCSHIVLAAVTYNGGIFSPMEYFIDELVKHNLMNRKVALIENGSWATCAGSKMKELISKCRNTEFISDTINITSAPKADTVQETIALAKAIADSLKSM